MALTLSMPLPNLCLPVSACARRAWPLNEEVEGFFARYFTVKESPTEP